MILEIIDFEGEAMSIKIDIFIKKLFEFDVKDDFINFLNSSFDPNMQILKIDTYDQGYDFKESNFLRISVVGNKTCKIVFYKCKSKNNQLELGYKTIKTLHTLEQSWLKNTLDINLKFNNLSIEKVEIEPMLRYYKEITGDEIVIYDEFFNEKYSTFSTVCNYERNPESLRKRELKNLFYYFQRIEFENSQEDKKNCYRLLFPILLNKIPKSYLAVFSNRLPPNGMDLTVLEIFAQAVLIGMQRELELIEVHKKFISDFIYDVIYRSYDKETDIFQKAGQLGINTKAEYVVIAIKTIGELNAEDFDKNGYIVTLNLINDRVMSFIEDFQKTNYKEDIVTKFDKTVYILHKIEFKNSSMINDICKNLETSLRKNFSGLNFQIGIGDVANGILEIKRSYEEAWNAIEYGSMSDSGDNGFVISCIDNPFLKILSRLSEDKNLEQLIPENLFNLFRENKDLYETLKEYLNSNCNAKQASSKLFIHYKTMLYRLEKIKEEYGINLHNVSSRLYIELGIHLLEINK